MPDISWLCCYLVLFQLLLLNVTIPGVGGVGGTPSRALTPATERIYSQDKVQIQMTRFSQSEGIKTNQKQQQHQRQQQQQQETNELIHLGQNSSAISQEIPFQVGGLGLASTAQNRISLGALTKTLPAAESRNAPVDHPISLHPTAPKRPPNEVVGRGWIDHTSQSQPKPKRTNGFDDDVSVRVMGQSIDPRVINHLNPDVSPYKARKLRKILAGSLDREWTSETAPRVLRQRGVAGAGSQSTDGGTDASQVDVKLISEAYNLNFTFRHKLGDLYTMSEEQLKPFRTWLIERATCEMEFIWEDLGSLFWPRWIRRGVCLNRPGQSCSWPPGMKCQPSGSRALRLLHWKCEDAAQIQSRKRAAEQRNRRRNAVNTFHSRFHDMKPAQTDFMLPRDTGVLLPRLSLRDTHNVISLPAGQGHPMRVQLREPRWSAEPELSSRETKEPVDDATREERRKRRARRLIKRLSVTANGYHCYWQVQKYLISDRCACLCS